EHIGKASTTKLSYLYFYYIFRNKLCYFKEVGGPVYGGHLAFVWLYSRWVVEVLWYQARRSNWDGVRGLLHGVWHGLQGKSRSIDEADLRGFDCIHLRVNAPAHNGITARGVLSYLAHLPLTAYRLLRLFKRYRVEVVNAHYPTLSIYSIAWLKRLNLFRGRLV